MEVLYQNLLAVTPQQVIMWIIGGVLIFLAIKKEMDNNIAKVGEETVFKFSSSAIDSSRTTGSELAIKS